MKHIYSDNELSFIQENYMSKGPKWISEQLNLCIKSVSKKARRMGLYRGIAAGNIARKNIWSFQEWSYDLGYLVGVYLGDGNIWQKNHVTSYYRLSVIDKDFCEAVQKKILKVTNYKSYISFQTSRQQWVLNFSNKDFCDWMITNFGPAKAKRISSLPTLEANKGMTEGLFDSEGTVDRYIFQIRMHGDLSYLPLFCKQLGIQHGPLHKGIRDESWQDEQFHGYSISNKEYAKVGLGTYIKRKAINGIPYKGD